MDDARVLGGTCSMAHLISSAWVLRWDVNVHDDGGQMVGDGKFRAREVMYGASCGADQVQGVAVVEGWGNWCAECIHCYL